MVLYRTLKQNERVKIGFNIPNYARNKVIDITLHFQVPLK